MAGPARFVFTVLTAGIEIDISIGSDNFNHLKWLLYIPVGTVAVTFAGWVDAPNEGSAGLAAGVPNDNVPVAPNPVEAEVAAVAAGAPKESDGAAVVVAPNVNALLAGVAAAPNDGVAAAPNIVAAGEAPKDGSAAAVAPNVAPVCCVAPKVGAADDAVGVPNAKELVVAAAVQNKIFHQNKNIDLDLVLNFSDENAIYLRLLLVRQMMERRRMRNQ